MPACTGPMLPRAPGQMVLLMLLEFSTRQKLLHACVTPRSTHHPSLLAEWSMSLGMSKYIPVLPLEAMELIISLAAAFVSTIGCHHSQPNFHRPQGTTVSCGARTEEGQL